MAENYFSKALKFNPATFAEGAKIGMWGKGNLDPGSPVFQTMERDLTPKQFAVPEGVDPNLAYLFPRTDPAESWRMDKERLDYIDQLQRSQAEYRQKLGEESTGKAVLYQSLANLGPMIAQAMNPGYLLEGANRIATTANEAFRSVPSMNVQSPGYSAGQFKYF